MDAARAAGIEVIRVFEIEGGNYTFDLCGQARSSHRE
jgi:hypothetical protein